MGGALRIIVEKKVLVATDLYLNSYPAETAL